MRNSRRILGSAALAAISLFAIASFILRHRSYTIPAPWRPAPTEGHLSLRYLGVSGYVLDDGDTVLVLDPAVSRPSVRALLSGPLDSDPALVARVIPQADYVLVNHTHYDHVLDAATVAHQTGATVLGSHSTANLMRARGVPETQIREISAPTTLELGSFHVEVYETMHPALFGLAAPMHGTIPPDAGPLWFWQFRLDSTFYFRIESARGALWFIPAGLSDPSALAGRPADTLILGLAGNPLDVPALRQIVAVTQPKRLLPTHYDNFFQPYLRGLGLLPTVDLDATYRDVQQVAPGLPWYVLDFDQALRL